MVDQMYGFLDETNIFDIDYFTSARKQTSKLLKILLMKGKPACKELFRVMEVDLKREVLINKMKEKSAEMIRRGMPVLDPKLRSLQITCLEEHEGFLLEELEPLELCDLLFEERAMDIPDHDRITETKNISKQVQHFLETVKKNENNCFHFLLYILKINGYSDILEELEKSDSGARGAESVNTNSEWRASQSFATVVSECVQNGSINVKLAMEGSIGRQLEQALHQQLQSSDTGILEEVVTHGQMNIEDVSSGSVVIQLRPITDQAVQTLLNARENNRLVELILGMIKRVNVPNIQVTEPLEVRVQVSYAHSAAAKPEISKAELIKDKIKVHWDELISELEPRALTSVLSKSDYFVHSAMDSIRNAPTLFERMEKLLSLIQDGDSKTVEAFITALKDIGYYKIVELIDPTCIHSKAENIRKMITSNYKSILDEMQITLAKETLSKCIGDIDSIREKILPKNGKRRQRMTHFLQFILQEDHNVIQFEKMLRNNGLEDLLKINENVHGEDITKQDIEMKIGEDHTTSSEGVLFECLLTLSLTEDAQTKPILTADQLSYHEDILIENMEPSHVADALFSLCALSAADHDELEKQHEGRKKAKAVIEMIRQEDKMHAFWRALEIAKCYRVIEYFRDNVCSHHGHLPSDSVSCVRFNYRNLLTEFKPEERRRIVFHHLKGEIFQHYNTVPKVHHLIKTCLRQGRTGCESLLKFLQEVHNGLLRRMTKRLEYRRKHGREDIDREYDISYGRLRDLKDFLLDELEPMPVSNVMLEEGAFSLDNHDAIEELRGRHKQSEVIYERLVTDRSEWTFKSFLFALSENNLEHIIRPFCGATQTEQRIGVQIVRIPVEGDREIIQQDVDCINDKLSSDVRMVLSIPVEGDRESIQQALDSINNDGQLKARLEEVTHMKLDKAEMG